MKTIKIIIKKNGDIVYVYTDKLRGLHSAGKTEITRASHVEPTEDNKWLCDMSPVMQGVVLGPFDTREEALSEEVKWLETHLHLINVNTKLVCGVGGVNIRNMSDFIK